MNRNFEGEYISMEEHQFFYEDHEPMPEKYGLSKERIEELIAAKIEYDQEKFNPRKLIGMLLTVISWLMMVLSIPLVVMWIIGFPGLLGRIMETDLLAFHLFIIPIIYYGIIFFIFWLTERFFKQGFIYQFEWNAYQRYLRDLKRYREHGSKH